MKGEGRTPIAKFLEARVSADHNFLPSEYLSYAEEVRKETTKPSTKPSTVIIWLLIPKLCLVNSDTVVTTEWKVLLVSSLLDDVGRLTGGNTGEEENFRPNIIEDCGSEFCDTPCSEKRIRSGHF